MPTFPETDNDDRSTELLNADRILSYFLAKDGTEKNWLVLKLASDWLRYPFSAHVQCLADTAHITINTVSSDNSSPEVSEGDIALQWDKKLCSQLLEGKMDMPASSQFGFCALPLPFKPNKVLFT